MSTRTLRWLTGAGTAHLVYTIPGHPRPITYDLATGRPVTACSSPPPFPLTHPTATDPLCGECFESWAGTAIETTAPAESSPVPESAQIGPTAPEVRIAHPQHHGLTVRGLSHGRRAIFSGGVPSCSRTALIANLSHPRRSARNGAQDPPGDHPATLAASAHDLTTNHHPTKGRP